MLPKAKVPLLAVATAVLDRVTTDPATDATVVPKAMPGPLTGIPTAIPAAAAALKVRASLPDTVALLAAPVALRAPVVWGVSTRMPLPTLVRPPAVPLMMPPKVVMICGLVTVSVRLAAPRFTLPLKVRLWVAAVPPNVVLPLIVRLLARILTVLSDWRVVPAAMVSVPVPNGPEVTAVPAVLPVLAAPRMSVPALSCTPPAKVLAPLSSRELLPALMSPAETDEFIAFWMTPEKISPIGEEPLAVRVFDCPFSSKIETMVGVEA